MNLVEMVKSQLSGNAMNAIAETLGTDHDTARSAVNAAVPSLLASLGSIASTSEGARRLENTVDSANESWVGSMGSMPSGGARSMMDIGSGLLSTVLGGSMLSSLAAALSRFTGINGSSISKLLGMFAPVMFGVIKRNKEEMGLDASGLANLLTSQKQNITSAMPAGLASMLGSVSGLSSLTGWTSHAAASAYEAGSSAVSQARDAARNAAGKARAATESGAAAASSALSWAIPLACLALVLVGVIWWFAKERGQERNAGTGAQDNQPKLLNITPGSGTAAPTTRPTTDTVDAASGAIGSAAESVQDSVSALARQATELTSNATDLFNGIKDSASADEAAPRLKELNDKLDSITTTVSALPENARATITRLFNDSRQKLIPLIDKALGTPGVGDKIRPVLEPIVRKLNALAGMPADNTQ